MIQTAILLSDRDISAAELAAVGAVLQSPWLPGGPVAAEFETAFAQYTGRKYAVAVSSGTLGMLLTLKAYGVGPEDEVIASPHSWREAAHAITLSGAIPRFADIDYWAGTLAPHKAESRITPKTRAIIAANSNGHPAPWSDLRELADRRGLILIEDSTEAVGSVYRGARVGSFGDCAVFDFSQPGPSLAAKVG
jgi:perosamine synthetase